MHMKKTICLIVAAVLMVLSVTACSNTAAPVSYFQYKLTEDGKVIITKYTGSSTSVEVPAELDGKKVTEIGEEDSKEVILNGFTLCGAKGSAAQTYARQNSIRFKKV